MPPEIADIFSNTQTQAQVFPTLSTVQPFPALPPLLASPTSSRIQLGETISVTSSDSEAGNPSLLTQARVQDVGPNSRSSQWLRDEPLVSVSLL